MCLLILSLSNNPLLYFWFFIIQKQRNQHNHTNNPQNLMIKTTGVGYTLNIVAVDSNGNAVASKITPPFSVATGKIFKLNFQVFVSASTGGTVFSPAPKVAVVDRGDNLVTEGSAGILCTAFLSRSPSGMAQLRPSQSLSTIFELGIATFNGLFINEAGFPYELSFNTTSNQVNIYCTASKII